MFNGLKNMFVRTDPFWVQCMREAEQKAVFTPDWPDLQTKYAYNVFLYNECQGGQPAYNRLGPSVFYRGAGYTESSDFVLYKKLLGKETFPLAFEITDQEKIGLSSFLGDPGQIMGQLFSVRPKNIKILDEYLLNTVYFTRKRVTVIVPYKEDSSSDRFELKYTEAFIYVARKEFWMPQISSSEGKRLFTVSKRLFLSKSDSNEPLGAYYTFDYNVEAHAP